ncbi:uncharacterized protein LOC135114980 isoform X2 [Scylla paramamosain]|uniref:uncharacterized protein LOC135114980 isoform X2 n=1 Tax=Scylla paramamosain TaxID=85552 RepID=UPI003082CDF2
MPKSAQSKQILKMEMNESTAFVSFGKKNGYYVKRSVTMLLMTLFVSSLVATGLEVVKETSVFTFHIITHNDTVKVVDAKNWKGKAVGIMKLTYNNKHEFYQDHLQQPLAKGHQYVLSMELRLPQ